MGQRKYSLTDSVGKGKRRKSNTEKEGYTIKINSPLNFVFDWIRQRFDTYIDRKYIHSELRIPGRGKRSNGVQ